MRRRVGRGYWPDLCARLGVLSVDDTTIRRGTTHSLQTAHGCNICCGTRSQIPGPFLSVSGGGGSVTQGVFVLHWLPGPVLKF